MAKAKIVFIEAYDHQGNLVESLRIEGKKYKRAALLDCLERIRPTGGVVREKEQNAPAWVTWYLEAGEKFADAGKPVLNDWTSYSRETHGRKPDNTKTA